MNLPEMDWDAITDATVLINLFFAIVFLLQKKFDQSTNFLLWAIITPWIKNYFGDEDD